MISVDFPDAAIRRDIREALNLASIPTTTSSIQLLTDILMPKLRKAVRTQVFENQRDTAYRAQNKRAQERKKLLPPEQRLSTAEYTVLVSMCQGLTVPESSDALGIPVDTIRMRRAVIYAKWRTHSQIKTVIMALRTGVVTLNDLDTMPDPGST